MFQTSVLSLESKQRQCNGEVAELQAKIGEYERLLEDNRSQVCCLLAAHVSNKCFVLGAVNILYLFSPLGKLAGSAIYFANFFFNLWSLRSTVLCLIYNACAWQCS